LKTHYGLPQSGALSQQRLFKHLEQHGYHQLFHAPALFRNKDGSIRFALVVDDFAVRIYSETVKEGSTRWHQGSKHTVRVLPTELQDHSSDGHGRFITTRNSSSTA
jgi:hypothetical protein